MNSECVVLIMSLRDTKHAPCEYILLCAQWSMQRRPFVSISGNYWFVQFNEMRERKDITMRLWSVVRRKGFHRPERAKASLEYIANK